MYAIASPNFISYGIASINLVMDIAASNASQQFFQRPSRHCNRLDDNSTINKRNLNQCISPQLSI